MLRFGIHGVFLLRRVVLRTLFVAIWALGYVSTTTSCFKDYFCCGLGFMICTMSFDVASCFTDNFCCSLGFKECL